jgi:hypothetical protein
MFGNGLARYEDAYTEVVKAEVPVKALKVNEEDYIMDLDFADITNDEACVELNCDSEDLASLKSSAYSLAMDFFCSLIKEELLSNKGALVNMYFSSQDFDNRD